MRTRLCTALLSSLAALLALASLPEAAPAAPSPAWRIESFAAPTDFSPAQNAECLAETVTENAFPACDYYAVTATDVAAAPTDGEAITLSDALPAGLTVRAVDLYWSGRPNSGGFVGGRTPINHGPGGHPSYCTLSPPVECTLPATFFTTEGRDVQPGDTLTMVVFLAVDEPAALESTLSNHATVEGGGAAPAEVTADNRLTEALPPFGLTDFSSYLAAPDGSPPTQAGAHAFELTTFIGLASEIRQDPEANGGPVAVSVEDLKDAVVDLPPGLAGSALSAQTCTFAQLSAQAGGIGSCPADSRVGMIYTHPYTGIALERPLYRIAAEHGVVAEYGFVDPVDGTHALYASLAPTPAGYTLRVTSPEITQIWLTGATVDFFGDPAARDAGRAPQPGDVPTFTMPANCDGEPLVTTVYVDSWQHPGSHLPDGEPDLADSAWVKATSESPPVSGCEALAGLFRPTLEAHPETNRGDSPTGLDVNLKVPQDESVETLATPPLRKAVVRLPQGMSVNPSSANGLQGCSLAQIGVSASGRPDGEAPQCPDASKIGEVELETPALSGVLHGQIYVAKQSENPFDSLLAIYIAIDDPTTGVIVKLPGEVRANPQTGQLETVVDNSPQFPFSELRTHFFGGQRAALAHPRGLRQIRSDERTDPLVGARIGAPGDALGQLRNHPGLLALGLPRAQRAVLQRRHRHPRRRSLQPLRPAPQTRRRKPGTEGPERRPAPGPDRQAGRGGGVPRSRHRPRPLARTRRRRRRGAGEPLLPGRLGSRHGHGRRRRRPRPLLRHRPRLPHRPLQGRPPRPRDPHPRSGRSLDLGDVVVRAALRLNPETAQVTAISDEIPHILHGIPLDVRSIALSMSRHEFTLNPTNCEKTAIAGEALSVQNQVANLSNPFQVGGCSALGFAPKLALSVRGKARRGANPTFKAVLTMPPGGANIARAAVSLPHSEFLDQAHIRTICTRVQFAAAGGHGEACPAASVYGRAEAVTPLLSQPLSGPVYLRSSSHNLPDLVAALNGQIDVDLDGTVDSVHGGIRNRFEVVPDAPVSRFVLEMQGGKKGLLQNSTDICAAKQRASAEFTAQNGKVSDFKPLLRASCPKPHRKPHRGHRRHQRGRGR